MCYVCVCSCVRSVCMVCACFLPFLLAYLTFPNSSANPYSQYPHCTPQCPRVGVLLLPSNFKHPFGFVLVRISTCLFGDLLTCHLTLCFLLTTTHRHNPFVLGLWTMLILLDHFLSLHLAHWWSVYFCICGAKRTHLCTPFSHRSHWLRAF